MSSLLYHAAPFSENCSSKEKKQPQMKQTFENIRREYKDTEPMTSMDSDRVNNMDRTQKMNSIMFFPFFFTNIGHLPRG